MKIWMQVLLPVYFMCYIFLPCEITVLFCPFRSSHCFQYVVYMCLSFGAVVNSYVVSDLIKGQPTRAE